MTHFTYNTNIAVVVPAIAPKLPERFKLAFNDGHCVSASLEIQGIDESFTVDVAQHDWGKAGIKIRFSGSYRYDLRAFSVRIQNDDEQSIINIVTTLDRFIKRYEKAKKVKEETKARQEETQANRERNMNELLTKFPDLTVPYSFMPYTVEYKGQQIKLSEYGIETGKFMTTLSFGKASGKEISLDDAMGIIDLVF